MTNSTEVSFIILNVGKKKLHDKTLGQLESTVKATEKLKELEGKINILQNNFTDIKEENNMDDMTPAKEANQSLGKQIQQPLKSFDVFEEFPIRTSLLYR